MKRLIFLLLLIIPSVAQGRVVRVEILSRSPIAGDFAGRTYERLTGRVYFAFDPNNRENKKIVDLALAPRNANGEVEAVSEFVMLRPVSSTQSANVALIDIVNRGGVTHYVFNLGRNARASPDSAAFYGDALLMNRGVTIVAIAWQWDVMPGGSALHFSAPQVGSAEHPVTGIVRSDITVDTLSKWIPLGHALAGGARGYLPADRNDPHNSLTVRDGPASPRRVIPHAQWEFIHGRDDAKEVEAPLVVLAGGFQPGKIYEVIYRGRDPVVVGAGMAAVRDMISYLKYDPGAIAHVKYGIGYGVSQTGRFIRHFLYQGFNRDERGRVAFDGFFAHTAGAGRGSFNHRFAQPSRDAQPYSTFFYPTDVFPFTSPPTRDPLTGKRGGLRDNGAGSAKTKVFYVDGGYEYWGRAASLTHTTPDGTRDVGFLPTERRYVISSAQHSSPAGWPLPDSARIAGTPAWRGDPLDQRLALRALMSGLIDWVALGIDPPASRYPTLASQTLVTPRDQQFPHIPNLPVARIPHQVYRMDFGPRWTQGIIDREPPTLGAPYPILVARVDSIGNDLGGIRSVEIAVPLATYYPWLLRAGMPAATDRLVSFRGTFVPLPKTEADRRGSGDSRPSIESLYGEKTRFMNKVDGAISALIAQRFMLPGDSSAARARMSDTWDRFAPPR
jgi:hypothetical protein